MKMNLAELRKLAALGEDSTRQFNCGFATFCATSISGSSLTILPS
jgi:hypothetical protein